MTDEIMINDENLERIKQLLSSGQKMAISTKTFEAIIEQLQRKEQECKFLEEEKQEKINLLEQIIKILYPTSNEDELYKIVFNSEYIDKLKQTVHECEELKKKEKYLYNFLTNRHNYGSFRPMWGAYLLKHFFKRDLGDFFDSKAYEMADTIEEKEKQLNRYEQALEKIEVIVNEPCLDTGECKSCKCNCEHKDILKILTEVKNEK